MGWGFATAVAMALSLGVVAPATASAQVSDQAQGGCPKSGEKLLKSSRAFVEPYDAASGS
jgi:hypothetical protein